MTKKCNYEGSRIVHDNEVNCPTCGHTERMEETKGPGLQYHYIHKHPVRKKDGNA